MAIKGKGRTKSKQVTRAPRKAPVVVKPPFLMRRSVQMTLALIAGVGTMVFAIWVTNGLRQQQRDKDADLRRTAIAKAVNVWTATVEGSLAALGQVPQPTPLFPELTAALATLTKGDEVKDAEKIATDARLLADKAASDLTAVKLYEVIRGKGMDLALTNYLLNSQSGMAQGLSLYSRAASLVIASTKESDPDLRATLVDEAQQVLTLATKTYEDGYNDYEQAKDLSGVDPQPPGGLPPGFPVPTG